MWDDDAGVAGAVPLGEYERSWRGLKQTIRELPTVGWGRSRGQVGWVGRDDA